MPDIDTLMQEWSPEFEELLGKVVSASCPPLQLLVLAWPKRGGLSAGGRSLWASKEIHAEKESTELTFPSLLFR